MSFCCKYAYLLLHNFCSNHVVAYFPQTCICFSNAAVLRSSVSLLWILEASCAPNNSSFKLSFYCITHALGTIDYTKPQHTYNQFSCWTNIKDCLIKQKFHEFSDLTCWRHRTTAICCMWLLHKVAMRTEPIAITTYHTLHCYTIAQTIPTLLYMHTFMFMYVLSYICTV